ncbi:MAG: cyclodeaminase [Firmicutes bacterium]|nr:cyclodeaminase [Bacillota bacterium]
MKIKILRENEIRSSVSLNEESIRAIAYGYRRLSEGKVSMPPVIRVDVKAHNGEVDIKTAYIEGLDSFAVKVASGFFDNLKIGIPYGSGMMLLMSAKTGFLEAILLDNGYLTDLRTGIAGAIAAKYLAPQVIKTAGVIGSGVQARYQIRGLKFMRDFKRLLIYGIDDGQVERYIKEISSELDLDVHRANSPEEVFRQSEFVVTTTPSREPYVKAEWLHAGMHITAMGADGEHKQELYADVFKKVDRIVCDSKVQCLSLGELHHAMEAGIINAKTEIAEIGDLTGGQLPGRRNEKEITLCDLTGVGVQDTAIALLSYQRACAAGLGLEIAI